MTETKSGEDTVEMDDSFSPQFIQEVNSIKNHIKRLVEENETRNFFRGLTSNSFDTTALLRVQFNNTMEKMEEKEKQSLVKELIKMVHHVAEKNSPDKIYIGTNYERVVDRLFRFAHEKNVISTTLCAEGLIMTTDFRLCSRICQEKWKFINECIPKIDYKGIRNILRYILESQLRRLPYALAPEQVNELRIVENVILHIVDRDSNLMPPLITLSEIMRGMPKQAHMLPRLTEKLANLSVHFRPIADLTHVCGRSFIYPIPLHPSFFPQTSFWEDFGVNAVNSFVQSHHTLPYRPEHTTTFLYTLYMILRQPLGKDSFNPANKTKTKSHWDVLISVMICESMAEAESLAENEPIPRYQWDNIVNIVNYGVTQHLLNPKNFFHVLRGLIKSCKYTRARDEVMWIVFQVVGSLSNVTRLDDAVQEIVDLYNDLFDGDVVWMGASDHPALFARFLAAASTWMLLEKDFGDKMPEANETIKSHIKFIHDGAENFDSSNTAMLAVLSNAYRTDSKIGKLIPTAMAQMLEATNEAQPIFELSYNRCAVNSFSEFAVEFLDALTYRSKKHLLIQCLHCLRTFTAEKLPSPAVFETIARICQSEDYELAVKDVESLAQRSLHVSNTAVDTQAKDQCFFLFDFLVYRLPHLPAYAKYSSTVHVLGHFTLHISNNPQNHQIYRLMEQFLMRRWCWSGFHECVANYTTLLGASNKDSPYNRYLMNPRSFSAPVDSMVFPINPEVFKMSIFSFLRAVKVTGQKILVENTMFPTLIAGYGWPKKSTHYFPAWALETIEKESHQNATPNYEEIAKTVKETARLHPSLTPHQFVLKYGEDRDPATNHCMLAVLYKIALDGLESKPDITSEFYEVMEKKTPKEIVVMGNYLVDYIIADSKNENCNEQYFRNVAKAAAILVFQYQVMRADRLLLSLVMHPSTDEEALLCVQIANEFLLTPELQERICWFHQNVPRKETAPPEYIKMIVKYHDAYPEFEACELVRKYDASSNPHMPTYYGCLIERLLPILDQFIFCALEQQSHKLHAKVLTTLAMFYKYHAMPIHFMYSVLFITHGKISGPDAKKFVMSFAGQIEEVHLTEAFEKFNHQKGSKEQLVMELIDRMSASLDFVLTPPAWVAKDWRTAELSPGAQTLYLACIELMASPHPPEDLVHAMINTMQMKPHLRPYNVVNLIALLLTALPASYADALHGEFLEVFTSQETAKLKFEEIVFDNYEEYQLVNLTNRARSVNVISQAYWTHCNLCLLDTFSREYVPKLLEQAKTEHDLWYILRLVMPILRRYWENWDTAKQMRSQREKFGPLFIVKLIFEKLGAMAEAGVVFRRDEHFCDLFYNCKYLFAGDFLRDTAIAEFAKLPEKMRDRLKFYVSQSEPVPRAPSPEKEEKEVEREKVEKEPEHAVEHVAPEPVAPVTQQNQAPPLQHPTQQHQVVHQMEHHQMAPEVAPPPQQQNNPMAHMTPQYPGMGVQHPMQHTHPMQHPMQQHPIQYGLQHHHPMQHHMMTPHQQQQYYMQQMQMQQQMQQQQQQQQQGQYMQHHMNMQ